MFHTNSQSKGLFHCRAKILYSKWIHGKIEVLFDTFSRKGRTPLRFCFAKSSVVTVFQEKVLIRRRQKVFPNEVFYESL
jgi:hypothetical protein